VNPGGFAWLSDGATVIAAQMPKSADSQVMSHLPVENPERVADSSGSSIVTRQVYGARMPKR
jgi:hypothetical protein